MLKSVLVFASISCKVLAIKSVLGFSREKRTHRTYIYIHIYQKKNCYKELVYVVIEAKKSHDVLCKL